MTASRKVYWSILGAVFLIGFGFLANPWIVKPDGMHDPVGEGMLIAIGVAGLAWIARNFVIRWNRAPVGSSSERIQSDAVPGTPTAVDRSAMLLIPLLIAALWLSLFWHRWSAPALAVDDFDYVAVARSWSSTYQNLLTPYNEHLCFPTRLFTWAICASFEESQWPRALARAAMLLFAATWLPIGWFVYRETSSPALAYLSVCVFALTTVHDEVVTWYSASQWCWALLLTLCVLLVLQGGERPIAMWRLVTSAFLAALGPLCYAIGVFAGPIGAVYLALRNRADGVGLPWRHCVVPMLGTAACLLVVVPLKARGVLQEANYGGKSLAEAASIPKGVLFGVRSTVDQLVLKNVGIVSNARQRRVTYAVVFSVAVLLVSELVRRSEQPVLPMLGCATVLIPYALTLPMRAWVQYESFLSWTRYQLFPQLGVCFVLCGALQLYGPRWLLAQRGSVRHAIVIAVVAVVQWLIHR